jgi:hypothetical protein
MKRTKISDNAHRTPHTAHQTDGRTDDRPICDSGFLQKRAKKQKRVEANVMNGKTFPQSLFLFVVLFCSINFPSEGINFLRKILLSVGIERCL